MAYSEINCRRIDHLLQSSCAHFFFFMRGATLGSCGGGPGGPKGVGWGLFWALLVKIKASRVVLLYRKIEIWIKKEVMESMITWAKTYFCTTVDKWYMYIIISVRRGRDTALKKNVKLQVCGGFFLTAVFLCRFSQFSRFLYIGIIFLAWERLRLQYNEKFRWPEFDCCFCFIQCLCLLTCSRFQLPF